MSFLDRVKDILLKRNEEELASLEARIREVTSAHSIESENVQKLKEESKVVSREKSQVQKNMISKKELEDLEVIYNFIANYPEIYKITEKIRHAGGMAEYARDREVYIDNEEDAFNFELGYRSNLYGIVKKLNEEIAQILNEEQRESQQDYEQKSEDEIDSVSNLEEGNEKKIGFFARVFGKDKQKAKTTSAESLLKKVKKPFNQYRRTIEDFKSCYGSFLLVDIDGPTVVDRIICTRLLTNINMLLGMQKRGIDLDPRDEEYLYYMQPHELWREISKYYSTTSELFSVIQNFEKNLARYEKLYKEQPELFDVKNLERIFEENDQLVVDFRSKNRAALSKNNEVARKKQQEKEIRAQLRTLEEKKKALIEKDKKIKSAGSLRELGYKNKEDAARKLSIDTKDYIVIPIPNGVQEISQIFNEEKELRVGIDGKVFFTTYSNDVATGKINTIEDVKNVDAVLMVPISELRKEDIDNIKSGRVSVNKSVLQIENLLVMMPEGRSLSLEPSRAEIKKYSYGTIAKQLKEFLGDDYVIKGEAPENYDVFKGIPNVSTKEKSLKKEAVKRCILENIKRDVLSTDTIYVNGKTFFINKDDEKEIMQGSKLQSLNEGELFKIVDEIEEYLIDDGKSTVKIDMIYKKLLMEYMRVNRKAKAEYYDEDNTTVTVAGKQMSVKPTLPSKDEKIARRYSRTREDVVYKTMKLAALVNKFAHLAENEELQNALFDVKLDLIENAIDLSKDNPNINLKRKFDESKMAMSVVLEIPGYNMIALHAMNKGNSLSYKANRLEETQAEVLQSSTILIPGVNKELLMAMRNMKEEERCQFLVDMEPTVFYKLALRMGYTTDKVSSEDSRKKFIKKMTSDKKIEELLEDYEELEK